MPISQERMKRTAIRASVKKLCLSTAIMSVLGTPTFAAEYTGVVTTDAAMVIIPSPLSFTAPSHAHGMVAYNGGSIFATTAPLSMTITGDDVHGAYALAGSTIGIDHATIITGGIASSGIFADGFGANVTMGNSQITTIATDSHGIHARSGGTIDAERVDVTTSGERAYGAYAVGAGSTITLNGAMITTTGAEAHGVLATGAGAQITISNSSVTALAGRGMRIENGGSINATNVKTYARNNHAGVYVAGVGSSLIYNGGSIETGGTGSPAIDVRGQATAELSDLTITTSANGSMGIQVLSGGRVDARNVDISTGTGTTAYGASASGAGSVLNYEGGSIKTATSRGLVAASGGTVNASNLDIGSNVIAVFANTNSSLTLANSTVSTHGDDARGINIQDRVIGTISDTKVTTDGNLAYGLSAASNSQMTATNVAVETSGENAYGVRATGTETQIDVIAGSYITHGLGASGIRATDNAVVNTDLGSGVGSGNTIITTTGEGSAGIFASTAATVNATGSQIMTLGIGSHGAVADTGATVNLVDGGLSTRGANANGLMATGGGLINIAGSTVQTYGVDSVGVSLADDSRATLDHTYVDAYFGPALKTESGNVTFDLKSGANVVGFTGTVLTAASGTTTTLMADGKSYLGGDMVAEANDAVIDASLSNGSQWRGAARGVTSASIDGTSYWRMTGSSDVGTLINDGVIEFDAANPYKTLTAGSLAMNGGSFILNTKLNEGGAASETDKIVVTGDATGNGVIHVRNNGGTGAFTGTGATDGIQVVEVGGASDAEFKLGSAAVVGIYDYQLRKADGQNWYLQTEGSDVVDPTVDPIGGDGENPGNGGGSGNPGTGNPVVDPGIGNPGTGHVVDIVPGYNIALSAAQNHVLTSLDTFHERLGELRAEELQDGYHAWMRGIGKTGSYSPKSITGYNGHGFDMTTAGVQIGADYSKSDVFVAGDKLTVGIFGEYANSSFDVRGRTADGSISSKGLGGYATWQQKAPTDRKPGTGAYVDAVVKQDWLDFGVSAKSVSGFDLQNGYKGKATTASIETGYGFDLGNNVVLQPQAQLTWSKVKADSFTDSYGIAVHGQEAESLIGRVGVRLEKTFYFGDEEETVEAAPVPAPKAQKQVKGKKGKAAKAVPAVLPDAPKKKKFVKSVTTYADANVKHEFKGKNGLVASNTGIGNDMGGTRYDVGVGVVARVSENVSLFGRGSVEFGGSTNVAGKVSGGLKITW
uniref:Outer membrane autotransporter barrel domain-containing protein n=1 Tax=Ochrobactrum sp. LM19 TaxID=1449781 RepID=A0A0D5A0J4_9HYPH|nr:autotransporter outer membrane beta-barrel domain-containing protein [Ochrobactrum sp. LM19]AJW29934.1 outer membrane autotransporter barrel domain-containing protein [Ochrobactrum sp. LM19]